MAEPDTLARPYAKAAFGLATAVGDLDGWSAMLARTAAAVTVDEFRSLLGHPAVPAGTIAALLSDFAGRGVDGTAKDYLRLLAERRRVALLPAIHGLFERLRAEAENRIVVDITSAVELDDSQRARFTAALKRRLGRDVEIRTGTDASILGGAVIRAGDLVIDGSVSGRLDKLATSLTR